MTTTQPDIPTNVSPPLHELYGRRAYIRSMLGDYERSSLGANARTTAREVQSIDQGKGGIYRSTAASGSLRQAAQASGARSRGYLENQIAKTRASSDMDLTGDISSQHSHEEDRRQGYAYAQAAGNAQQSAQKRAEYFQMAGLLGGAAIALL